MTWQIKAGDARAVLAGEAAGSVQTVVTSPPFYGLRAYQTEPQIWGGAPGCDHVWGDEEWISRAASGGERAYGSYDGKTGRGPAPVRPPYTSCMVLGCGAWRGELGSEPTVDLYVAHLVEVFRAMRRVLRADGTCWVNLGDSFSNPDKGGAWDAGRTQRMSKNGRNGTFSYAVQSNRGPGTGLGPKQLMLVPARFALAMQADGWILRQDIIWSKPNAMPESVTDRPTTAHEHVFLFAKAARYFYDAAAIAEPAQYADHHNRYHTQESARMEHNKNANNRAGSNAGLRGLLNVSDGTRNKRSVWEIPTAPYPGAHFATWPPALVEPMIRAGSRPGDLVCDPFCGAGTTGMVALRLGRAFLGIDLQPAYVALAGRRIIADCPLFNMPQEATA